MQVIYLAANGRVVTSFHELKEPLDHEAWLAGFALRPLPGRGGARFEDCEEMIVVLWAYFHPEPYGHGVTFMPPKAVAAFREQLGVPTPQSDPAQNLLRSSETRIIERIDELHLALKKEIQSAVRIAGEPKIFGRMPAEDAETLRKHGTLFPGVTSPEEAHSLKSATLVRLKNPLLPHRGSEPCSRCSGCGTEPGTMTSEDGAMPCANCAGTGVTDDS